MNHSVVRRSFSFREVDDRGLDSLTVECARVERQRRSMAGNRRELRVIDVDRDDFRAERVGDLHTIAAHAAGADDDGETARL